MKSVYFSFLSYLGLLLMVASTTSANAATVDELAAEFQTILDKQAFAHAGPGVDYLKLADNIAGLKAHVGKYNSLSVTAATTENQRKAAYYNLYNAATLHAIAKNLASSLGSKKDAARTKAYKSWAKGTKMTSVFGGVKPWLSKVKLAGATLTIDQIEHALLRRKADKISDKKVFKKLAVASLDARLHAAVNCGAIDCPPVNKKAYTASNIEGLLKANMTNFLISKFAIKGSKMHGSSIVFGWYLADFVEAAGAANKVGPYLNTFLDAKKHKTIVDFFNANPTITTAKYKHSYNWLVNDRNNY